MSRPTGHANDCWCLRCFNEGAALGDAMRKAKLVDPVGHPQAADRESMMVWFDYYRETVCKA